MSKIAKKVKSFNKDTPKPQKILNCIMDWDSKSVTKGADGAIYIEGYANTKDKDRVADVVLPEAFKATMPEYMKNPMILYMHDWNQVAGKVVEYKIDDNGLWIKVQISNAKDCENIRTKIKEGILKTFSIGYNELDADWDKETATNYVKEVELLEVSIVSIPCNPRAEFAYVTPEEGKDDEGKAAPQPEKTKNIELSDEFCSFLADACNLVSEKIDSEFIKELTTEFNKMEEGKLTEIYKLIFPKSKYTKEEAIKWAEGHGHKTSPVNESEKFWEISQRNKSDFKEESFEDMELTDDIKITIGHLKD